MVRRQLTRELTVNLERLAGALLVDRVVPHEEVMEVYRWIAVTMDESGVRWRELDPWSHRRYKAIREALGLRQWSTYPTNEDGFGLCFLRSSTEYQRKVRDTIIRAAFGDAPDLVSWRHDQRFPMCTVSCRVLKRADGRRHDPLERVYATRPGIGLTYVKGAPRLNLSFNSIHKRCQTLFAFVLVPEMSGWHLAVSFGGGTARKPNGAWTIRAREWQSESATADIPVQLVTESANEFFARSCVYIRSILATEPEPLPRDPIKRLAAIAGAQAAKVADRAESYTVYEVGRRVFAARDQQHAISLAMRKTRRD